MLNLSPAILIARLITLTIAFTIHEFTHAWTADFFGDPTPRQNGRVTLNPAAHLDLLGSLLLLVAGFGWARPVPVNPYALQSRSRWAHLWVAFGGPFSNMVMAFLGAIPLRFGWITMHGLGNAFLPSPYQILTEFVFINLILAFFNLIPLAPLDGETVLSELLPPDMALTMERIRPYGPAILLALVFVLPYLGIDLLSMLIFKPAFALFMGLVG